MMDRIKEFDLYDILMQHDGILMGYSAGAVIQLAEYHLSPDDDYPEFKYYEGLPYLNDFYMEVHYEGTAVQDESIQRVLAERGKPCTQLLCDLALFSWIMETLNCSVMSRCLADRATEKRYEFCNERTNKQRLVK